MDVAKILVRYCVNLMVPAHFPSIVIAHFLTILAETVRTESSQWQHFLGEEMSWTRSATATRSAPTAHRTTSSEQVVRRFTRHSPCGRAISIRDVGCDPARPRDHRAACHRTPLASVFRSSLDILSRAFCLTAFGRVNSPSNNSSWACQFFFLFWTRHKSLPFWLACWPIIYVHSGISLDSFSSMHDYDQFWTSLVWIYR